MDTSTYTPQQVYRLSPYVEGDGVIINIDQVVCEQYGREYSSLRGAQNYDEHLYNGAYLFFTLSSDEDYEQALWDLDEPGVYLGYNYLTRESLVLPDVSSLEYWNSLSVAPSRDLATVGDYTKLKDCRGKTFPDQFSLDAYYTPPLPWIVADMIRRGALPRGDYLYHHDW